MAMMIRMTVMIMVGEVEPEHVGEVDFDEQAKVDSR
jgi:hypothetical protein